MTSRLAILLLLLSVTNPAHAEDVERVTTDTLAYCHHLAGLFDPAVANHEATRLHEEGIQLCAQGNVRPGVMRLRRALLAERPQVTAPAKQ